MLNSGFTYKGGFCVYSKEGFGCCNGSGVASGSMRGSSTSILKYNDSLPELVADTDSFEDDMLLGSLKGSKSYKRQGISDDKLNGSDISLAKLVGFIRPNKNGIYPFSFPNNFYIGPGCFAVLLLEDESGRQFRFIIRSHINTLYYHGFRLGCTVVVRHCYFL